MKGMVKMNNEIQEFQIQNENSSQVENGQISILEKNGLKVTESMTTPKKAWKKPRPVWVVSGNCYGLEQIFYDLGGKKYHGNWSFFDDPTDGIIEALQTSKRLSFEEQQALKIERKENRIEKFEQYAENAEERSNQAYKKSHEISSFIPMGQPILVGHHSERRHRRDLSRIDNQMRKSVAESNKADYYESKVSRLSYEVNRNKNSRAYLGNRIKEAQSSLSKLQRQQSCYDDVSRIEEFNSRIQNATEELNYWSKSLSELETELTSKGAKLASPENIKPGYFVKHRGSWYPVKRVNKKTVTIANWLGIPTFTFQIPYTEIESFKENQGAG
jgi:hypothetical protein